MGPCPRCNSSVAVRETGGYLRCSRCAALRSEDYQPKQAKRELPTVEDSMCLRGT